VYVNSVPWGSNPTPSVENMLSSLRSQCSGIFFNWEDCEEATEQSERQAFRDPGEPTHRGPTGSVRDEDSGGQMVRGRAGNDAAP
jgi:hypothetical protein